MRLLVFVYLFFYGLSSWADTEILNQKQYTHWLKQLRCPVCQGQNIGESNAKIAFAMRAQLLKLIKDNKTNIQIKQYFLKRYGQKAFNTPMGKSYWDLWLLPYVLFFTLLVFAIFPMLFRKNND